MVLFRVIISLVLVVYLGFRFRSFPIFILAMRAYSRGKTQKALDFLKRAVEAGLAEKHQLTAGYILLKEGSIDDAGRIFNFLSHNRGRKFNAQHARNYLALIQWKQGQLDQAVTELETLLKENYRSTSLYSNLGYFLIEQGELKKALDLNQEAVEYDDESPVILDNLGLTHILLGNWDQADAIYHKLLNMNPEFPEAWYNASCCALEKGDKDKAAALLTESLGKKFSYLSTLNREKLEAELKKIQAGP